MNTLSAFHFLLQRARKRRITDSRVTTRQGGMRANRATVLMRHSENSTYARISRHAPLRFLLFHRSRIYRHRQHGGGADRVRLSLLHRIHNCNVAGEQATGRRLVINFGAQAPRACQVNFQLIIRVVGKDNCVRRIRRVKAVLPTFLVRFLRRLFDRHATARRFQRNVIGQAGQLTSRPSVCLASAKATRFIFRFTSRPRSLTNHVFCVVCASSSCANVKILRFMNGSKGYPNETFHTCRTSRIEETGISNHCGIYMYRVLCLLMRAV